MKVGLQRPAHVVATTLSENQGILPDAHVGIKTMLTGTVQST